MPLAPRVPRVPVARALLCGDTYSYTQKSTTFAPISYPLAELLVNGFTS